MPMNLKSPNQPGSENERRDFKASLRNSLLFEAGSRQIDGRSG
jgi:hypothetical protein